MNTELIKILKNRKIYYSQSGEDGVLEYIISQLPSKDKWCVEFGAWDGKHLSNTYHFISDLGYQGVLIEADKEKYKKLSQQMESYNVVCFNKFVNYSGPDTLDNILQLTSIPKDFDLLSIDIDGNDYFIFDSIKLYSPKVIIIEINIMNKPQISQINDPASPIIWGVTGSSIKSISELAQSKGYKLIANVGCNAIYIRQDYFHIFYSHELKPEDVFLFEGHKYSQLSLKEKIKKFYFKIFFYYIHFCPK